MKTLNFRVLLSAICMVSILAGFTRIDASPIRFEQVVQVINARPGKAETRDFSRLRVAGDYTFLVGDDDDEKKKKTEAPQDDRVITETRSDIVLDDVCDCEQPEKETRGFPKWALLGLAAIPIAFIIIHHDDESPTPTRNIHTQTPTPSMTATMTPPMTSTPTPPPMTPTPTPPEPVPEPMTILLFGTGLASIGLAARRKYGKKSDEPDENDED